MSITTQLVYHTIIYFVNVIIERTSFLISKQIWQKAIQLYQHQIVLTMYNYTKRYHKNVWKQTNKTWHIFLFLYIYIYKLYVNPSSHHWHQSLPIFHVFYSNTEIIHDRNLIIIPESLFFNPFTFQNIQFQSHWVLVQDHESNFVIIKTIIFKNIFKLQTGVEIFPRQTHIKCWIMKETS
jgi:hypothetical protein